MRDVLITMTCIFGAIIGFIVSITAAISLCAWLWSTTISRWACEDFQTMIKMETQFSVWQGCYVTLDTGEVVSARIAEKVRAQKYNLMYEDKY